MRLYALFHTLTHLRLKIIRKGPKKGGWAAQMWHFCRASGRLVVWQGLKLAWLVPIPSRGGMAWCASQTKGNRMTVTYRIPSPVRLALAGLALLQLTACSITPLNPFQAPVAAAAAPAAAPAPAPDKRESAGMVAPLVEKRETLTATGYAVISVQNHRNPAQQRLLAIRAAKLDAYRALTEQVYGQQLDATTTVADMVVQSDTFRTRVEGVIYGAVLVSITPASDDTYETTLSLDKAVVQDLRALYLGQVQARGR